MDMFAKIPLQALNLLLHYAPQDTSVKLVSLLSAGQVISASLDLALRLRLTVLRVTFAPQDTIVPQVLH
jgi:hypothetical protein